MVFTIFLKDFAAYTCEATCAITTRIVHGITVPYTIPTDIELYTILEFSDK